MREVGIFTVTVLLETDGSAWRRSHLPKVRIRTWAVWLQGPPSHSNDKCRKEIQQGHVIGSDPGEEWGRGLSGTSDWGGQGRPSRGGDDLGEESDRGDSEYETAEPGG